MTEQSTYIIAEIGVNHNGDKALALELIDIAAEAGANAVKFQTFNAKKLASQSVQKAAYQIENTQQSGSQQAMLAALELPLSWHHDLAKHCQKRQLDFLSTGFDHDSLAFLQSMALAKYKIPSGEVTNDLLLWQFGQIGRPLILSTGMATLAEVEHALAVLAYSLAHAEQPKSIAALYQFYATERAGSLLQKMVTLLHCTSQYPAPMQHANLKALTTMQTAFSLPVGYSDHTEGHVAAVASIALGGVMLEKHITLDKTLPGPDHKASLEPDEFKAYVAAVRAAESAMGTGRKLPTTGEWDTRLCARQSLICVVNKVAGEPWQFSDFSTQRLGQGMAPSEIWSLVDTPAAKDYVAGEAL